MRRVESAPLFDIESDVFRSMCHVAIYLTPSDSCVFYLRDRRVVSNREVNDSCLVNICMICADLSVL